MTFLGSIWFDHTVYRCYSTHFGYAVRKSVDGLEKSVSLFKGVSVFGVSLLSASTLFCLWLNLIGKSDHILNRLD